MQPATNDIGAFISAANVGISIQEVDAGTDVNGSGIDRKDYMSCTVVATLGAASGSPSAQTHEFIVEESSDNSSFTAITGATITLTADDSAGEVDIDLQGKERYIRVTYDASESSFTGGSSPANDIAAVVILGGAKDLPA